MCNLAGLAAAGFEAEQSTERLHTVLRGYKQARLASLST